MSETKETQHELKKDNMVIDPKTNMYIRTKETERDLVKQTLRTLYGGIPEYVEVTSSGMNSIQLVMTAMLDYINMYPINNVILFADELYCDTQVGTINYLKEYGIEIVRFNQSNYQETKLCIDKYKDRISCMFLESCSNPHGKITDWKILDLLPSDCYVIVDNTWLSPAIFNPFNHKVHIVIESCTKYLTGSKIIMGHVCCRTKSDFLTRQIERYIKLFGVHVSPIYCKLLNEQLDKLKERVSSSISRTDDMIKKIQEVKIPDMTIYSSNIYDKKYKSSIILFEVKITKEEMNSKKWKDYFSNLIEKNKISYETSYGKEYDAICCFPHKTQDYKFIEFRLALGYNTKETIDTLFSSLMKIIKNI